MSAHFLAIAVDELIVENIELVNNPGNTVRVTATDRGHTAAGVVGRGTETITFYCKRRDAPQIGDVVRVDIGRKVES